MEKYLKDLENDSSLIYDGPFMIKLSRFSTLPYNIIEKYAEWLDWHEICHFKHMSNKFMSKPNILPYIRFDIISRTQRLTEEFIEKHKDKVEWSSICSGQKMSEDFLLKHIEYLVIEPLLYNTKIKLTDNFWRTLFTYCDDIEINGRWMPHNLCQTFSVNLIREFRDRFTYLHGKMINSRDKKVWNEFNITYWNLT